MCAMPSGKKIDGGYFSVASIPGADDYKLIANKCTDLGYSMGHSTARNVFLSAMMKIANSVQKSNQISMNEKELYDIARNPRFQMSVAEVLKGN
jgi:hypothetical protein